MKYPTISIQIICKDEERVIGRCLEAINNQINMDDEIIVVDTGSTDKTKEIIKESFPNVKLLEYIWENDFSRARNFAVSKTSKDWIFCVDSDEVLQPKSLENLCDSITKIESVSDEPIVFCPKVLNVDDTIVYNAGRVIKNTGEFKFYGCVHEYPIYKNKIECENYVSLRLPNVVMLHDGYSQEVVGNKKKAKRNSDLDKRMIEEFPESDRYYYFYYRDAKEILSDEEYEKGLKKFPKIHPNSNFLTQVYSDLICYLISKSKTEEAEVYLEKYWGIVKLREDLSDVDVIRLSALNELQKIYEIQKKLIQILTKTKETLFEDENRLVENGYILDDIIAFLYWSLGEGVTAKKIHQTLKKKGYQGMLDKLFKLPS